MRQTSTPHPNGDVDAQRLAVRLAPHAVRPYLILMRLDRPNGIALVMAPCWWAVAMAANGWPNARLLALFALGALLMRGAGSVINDIIDRDVDAQVRRTAWRPLPAGQVSVRRAWIFATVLCLGGLAVLMQFNHLTIALGPLALMAVLAYPFAKRHTHWPQLALGVTVGFGALMGWTAATGSLGPETGVLFAATVAWTAGWDTIYGHQDMADDPAAGVRSGALRLAPRTRTWLTAFYGASLGLIAMAGWMAGLGPWFYAALLAPGLHLAWQVHTFAPDDAEDCRAKFCANAQFGLLTFAAVLCGQWPAI